jgi:addiction module HigA family antidote
MTRSAPSGDIVREEVIRPLALTVTEAAKALGVTRQALSAFLNERTDLSPEMALRIEITLDPKADVNDGPSDGLRYGAGPLSHA